MMFNEAVALYAAALARYFHPLTGHGSSAQHVWGDEKAYARHSRAKDAALNAPEEAQAAIVAAGIDFEAVRTAIEARHHH